MSRILRVLRGEHLPCGCTVGVYETYDGRTLRVVDVHAGLCRSGQHRPGVVLPNPDVRFTSAEPPRDPGQPTRQAPPAP